jgi:hypothetical protein
VRKLEEAVEDSAKRQVIGGTGTGARGALAARAARGGTEKKKRARPVCARMLLLL